jgi:hypothetical protein
VFGLAQDLAQRKVLGDDLDIEIKAFDETNTVIPIAQIARRILANNGQGLVCLVGVQSNQYPRAMDIARQFCDQGVQVAIGGFHVSGCLSMLPTLPEDLREAQSLGISLFAGEAEGRLEQIFADAINQRMAPLYNFMDDLPGLENNPHPFFRKNSLSVTPVNWHASMQGAAARSLAVSARLLMCKAANRDFSTPMISKH